MLAATAFAQPTNDGLDLLTRSMAVYPTLSSYADTGTAVMEAPGLVDRWKFKPIFRRPLDFYFDFQGVTRRECRSQLGLELAAHRPLDDQR
jgi:hypothetical protein